VELALLGVRLLPREDAWDLIIGVVLGRFRSRRRFGAASGGREAISTFPGPLVVQREPDPFDCFGKVVEDQAGRQPQYSVVVRPHDFVASVVLRPTLAMFLPVDFDDQSTGGAVEVRPPAQDLLLPHELEAVKRSIPELLPQAPLSRRGLT
jgi:hypothetical protein